MKPLSKFGIIGANPGSRQHYFPYPGTQEFEFHFFRIEILQKLVVDKSGVFSIRYYIFCLVYGDFLVECKGIPIFVVLGQKNPEGHYYQDNSSSKPEPFPVSFWKNNAGSKNNS